MADEALAVRKDSLWNTGFIGIEYKRKKSVADNFTLEKAHNTMG